MSAKHISEHKELIRLAERILALVSGQAGTGNNPLPQLRLSFARLVNAHCDEEGRLVRDAVRRGSLCPRLVATFERELIAWRADLASCNAEWPLSRIAQDPSGFHQRFGRIVEALRDYVGRENRQILSALAA